MTNTTYSNPVTGLELAVIGMAARFPGAQNIEEYWENLKEGKETVTYFSEEELQEAGVSRQLLENPDYVKAGAMLDDIDCFDAAFFDYTPVEAGLMDPQQRIFHQCAWHALEDAGYDPLYYNGPIGLYAGASSSFEWKALVLLSGTANEIGLFALNQLVEKDYLSLRITYKFNLRGPAITMYTACSTSLVSIHMACQGILNGECMMALAGGVTVSNIEKKGYLFQEGSVGSRDGHTRAFDSRSAGTISGSGAGVVVLKRLADAIVDRDYIYAVVKGTAINNDGVRKVGFTAPSVEGQVEVMRIALMMAEVNPESIQYVENHGTATELGDPVEIEALKLAFKTDKKHYCALGSVKSNFGHLDSASGVAGFIKAVLALDRNVIPPSLHFESSNPAIDFENSPFYVNNRLLEWKRGDWPRRAAVNSLGIGGTNAHVILEERPEGIVPDIEDMQADTPETGPDIPPSPPTNGYNPQLILLSAKTPSALEQMTFNLVDRMNRNPHIDLADTAYSLQVGRRAFAHRFVTVCSTNGEAMEILSKTDSPKRHVGRAQEDSPPVVFMFSGQGSQYVNMGLDLYRNEPQFRREMDRCFRILESITGEDFKSVLYPGEPGEKDKEKINDMLYSGPVKFTIEYSMARLLVDWGIEPYALVGHSFGEYVAACLAEVFSLEDALKLVVVRGRLMVKTPPGAMMSVALPEKEVIPLLGDSCFLAAVNSENLCIISGLEAAIQDFEACMEKKGIETIRINVTCAGHSPVMRSISSEFEAEFRGVQLKKPKIPYISCLTGDWITAQQAESPSYWCRHMEETVRFHDGITTLLKTGNPILVQVSSDRGLPLFVGQHPGVESEALILNLVRHPKEQISDMEFLLMQIGRIWSRGVPVRWEKIHSPSNEKRSRVPLPGYPFAKQRFPFPADPLKQGGDIIAGRAPFLKKPDMTDWFYIPTWSRTRLPVNPGLKFSEDSSGPGENWLIFDNKGNLAARMVQLLEQYGQRVTRVTEGKEFARENSDAFTVYPERQDDFIRLVRELKENRQIPRRIVHLWSLGSGAGQERGQWFEEVDRALSVGFYTLFYLVRALGEEAVSEPLKIDVITDGMQDVSGGDLIHPLQAAVLGPVKVIPLEYPSVACRSIDILLPGTGTNNEELLAKQLTAELLAAPPEPVVAYRGGSRWEPGVKPVRLEKKAPGDLPLKSRGVYLITGGLGGIGLELAQHLATSVQAKLILTTRSQFPPTEQWDQWLGSHDESNDCVRKIKALRRLEAQGGEVLVLRADTADIPQMQTAVHVSLERFGAINGVIHCAGVPDGAAIAQRTRKMTDTILAPKIKGTLVLDSIFKDMKSPPDFLVLCSSINAIIPAFGQLAHCGANAFMDAFAQYRASTGCQSATISINWNSWLEVGQAVETSRKSGNINGLLSREGIEVFERVLGDMLPGVIVSTVDFSSLIDRFYRQGSEGIGETTEPETSPPAPLRMKRPELENEYTPPRNGLEQALVEIWQKNFGYEKIGIHDNFFQLGGDSLKGMMFVNQYKKLLQEIVHVTVVFNAPTIAELGNYFSEHYPDAAARLNGQHTGKVEKEKAEERIDAGQIARVRRLLAYPLAPLALNPGEEKNSPAVFILSPARSGSTLLRVILAGHPKLFAPPELAVLPFNTLAESKAARQGVLRALMQIKDNTLPEAEKLLHEMEQQGITIKEFYHQVQEWLGGRLLVDKTPGYALDKEVLKRAEMYFKDPLYIHLVRHPLDMIRSFEEARLDLFFGSNVLEELSLTRRELAELDWTISHLNIREFFEHVPEHRRCRVVFEELLHDPGTVVNNLCRFLGVEFYPDMLDPYKETKQRMTDGIHKEGLMIGDVKFHQHKGINPAVADTWKQHYRENFLGDITIELAESFGYHLPKRGTEFNAHQEKKYTSIQPAERRDYYPLSPSQKQLFVLQQLDPRQTGYNMIRVLSLSGESIDIDRLDHTFKHLIARHESLRTSFHLQDEQPVQKVHDEVEFKVEVYHNPLLGVRIPTGEEPGNNFGEEDSTGLTGSQGEIDEIVKSFVRPFDLSRAPLIRVGLVRLPGENDLLLIDIHHIISDAASHGLIARDVTRIFAGKELLPLKLRYRDYVLWLHRPRQQAMLKQQEAWWLKTFSGDLPILNLHTDYPRPPVRSYEGDTRDFQVGKENTIAMRTLAAGKKVTLNMLMLGIFHVLLSRFCGQEDITTGTSIKGRGHPDLEEIIGIFINTIPLRTYPSAEKTFWEYLEEVRETAVNAYDNQDYPFEELVKKVWNHRNSERNPLFDVMFEIRAMGPNPKASTEAGDAAVIPLRHKSQKTKFDLDWMGFEHEEGVFFTVTFCSRLFKKETVEFLCNSWVVLMEEVINSRNNRDLKIKELGRDIFSGESKQDDDLQFDF